MYKLHFPLEQTVWQAVQTKNTILSWKRAPLLPQNTLMHLFSVCAQTHHIIPTVYATSSSWDARLRRHPRPGRKRDVSGENITRRSEPWQSEGLSEMVPRGTEMEGGREARAKRRVDWDSLPAWFKGKPKEGRGSTRQGEEGRRRGEGHRVARVDVETEPLHVWELRGRRGRAREEGEAVVVR